MNIPPYFKEYKDLLEEYLKRALSNEDKDIDLILDAARYSALSAGKRIRGCIVLSIGSLFGPVESFLPLAAAIEMIHTYSLIHDDLPAMDDDDFRRGKPSNHKVYGEDMAILAGDFLMTRAYELIAEQLVNNGFSSDKILKTIVYLSKAIGSQGMVGGQVMDIKSTDDSCDLERLKKIHDLKTGRFIRASFICPIILSSGLEKFGNEFPVKDYADKLGLLFQVVDDILDETADEKTLGKPTGSDKENNKATYVALMGLEEAQQYAQKIYENIIEDISVLDNKIKNILLDFADMIYKRNK